MSHQLRLVRSSRSVQHLLFSCLQCMSSELQPALVEGCSHPRFSVSSLRFCLRLPCSHFQTSRPCSLVCNNLLGWRRSCNCLKEFPVTQTVTSLVYCQNSSRLLLHRIPFSSPPCHMFTVLCLVSFALPVFLHFPFPLLTLSLPFPPSFLPSLSLFLSLSSSVLSSPLYQTTPLQALWSMAKWRRLPLSLSFSSLHESLTLNTSVTD